MTIAELIEKINASGRDAGALVTVVVDSPSPTRRRYNVLQHDGKIAVGSLVTDRSNGDLMLYEHLLPDGTSTPYFGTVDEACDWIWADLNNPALGATSEKSFTPEELSEQRARQEKRHEVARRAHMRSHPELWEEYFRSHPEERPPAELERSE